jgi:hypothetical protein
MASASSSAMAVPAALSPAIMMSCSVKPLPVRGCAARMPASTTAAVPCEAHTCETVLQLNMVQEIIRQRLSCAGLRYLGSIPGHHLRSRPSYPCTGSRGGPGWHVPYPQNVPSLCYRTCAIPEKDKKRLILSDCGNPSHLMIQMIVTSVMKPNLSETAEGFSLSGEG